MSEHSMPLPLTYRADLLQQVMPALQAGECCSLVGTSGVGKSNLVRFLQRPDVQRAYWGDKTVWMVLIDTNGLSYEDKPDGFAVAELMIHRLIREAERRHLDSAIIADFDARYLQLVERRNPLLAVRSLERICGQLCEAGGVRLVFLFDQFEDLWKSGDARLFLQLRHLRDEFKYQLSYLVMTRERLQRTRQQSKEDSHQVESFWELFSSHTYGLGAYNADDASTMIDRMAARRHITVSDDARDIALRLSGGHPGLLRALFWEVVGNKQLTDAPEALLKIEPVADECRKIWNDLLQEEQSIIRTIAAGYKSTSLSDEATNDLRLKKLITGTPPRIFSPVFGAYAHWQTGDISGLVVNIPLREVWLEGQVVPKLSRLEFNLLAYLARHTDRVCSREELLRHLYEDSFGANDERLDALLRRLRSALNETATAPRYLHNSRGVGFQLVNGRIQE